MSFKDWVENTVVIPFGNIWIPHPSINRIYADKVAHYQKNPDSRPPKGVVSTKEEYRGWVRLRNRHNRAFRPDPLFPQIFITDGVHRIIAAVQNGEKGIRVSLQNGRSQP